MTTRLIYGQEDILLPWAAKKIGINGFRRDAFSIGIERDGALVAVVAYDTFSDCECHMHVASDGAGRWLTRGVLAALFAYPFIQLGFRRVTAPVAARNVASQKFCRHLGFQVEGYCQHGMKDDDVVVMGMIRESCRFIKQEI